MSATNGVRRCFGCSEPLTGRQRRFCSERCRSRARRSGRSEPAAIAVEAGHGDRNVPTVDPGSCVDGLESYLEGIEDELPAAVVAHARSLARQVDADPGSSPLHGRYSTTLEQLVAASTAVVGQAMHGFYETTSRQIATGCESQLRGEHRLLACGECVRERVRACVRGSHVWEPYGGDPACEFCGTRRSGRRERN